MTPGDPGCHCCINNVFHSIDLFQKYSSGQEKSFRIPLSSKGHEPLHSFCIPEMQFGEGGKGSIPGP